MLPLIIEFSYGAGMENIIYINKEAGILMLGSNLGVIFSYVIVNTYFKLSMPYFFLWMR